MIDNISGYDDHDDNDDDKIWCYDTAGDRVNI